MDIKKILRFYPRKINSWAHFLLFIGGQDLQISRTRRYELGLWRSDCRLNLESYMRELPCFLRMKRPTSWFSKPLLRFIKRLLSLKQYYSKPVSDFLTSSANISLHRDEQEVGGLFRAFSFHAPHNVVSLHKVCHVNKRLEPTEKKNVPAHSRLRKSPIIFTFQKNWD